MNLVFASPNGGEVQMAPKSREEAMRDEHLKEFFQCREVMDELKNTKRIQDLTFHDIMAVVLIGGHGCLVDFAPSEQLSRLIQTVKMNLNFLNGRSGTRMKVLLLPSLKVPLALSTSRTSVVSCWSRARRSLA